MTASGKKRRKRLPLRFMNGVANSFVKALLRSPFQALEHDLHLLDRVVGLDCLGDAWRLNALHGVLAHFARLDRPLEEGVGGAVAGVDGGRFVAARTQVVKPLPDVLGRDARQQGESAGGKKAREHAHGLAIVADGARRPAVAL